ncbi:GNAT family N-acetyltransferase [Nonomuraea jiangxiensis]|uniref:Predicted acetyltransferase, GNAT family n=1 Tax=Nonomuraea jiangxiensis TaxID=633440 RepID=A0A1G9D3W0_9ACTN|nr:GNAT family N-acetyltransferase [Nonomuraea jiangxiensis]SDK58374.1 Predicted acetyltransferase, GNAT family [Nonomuraea jiangxiensis]
MNHEKVLAAFDRELRRQARPDGPETRVERAGDVVRQVGPEHAWNGVIWSDLDARRADAAIAEQVRYFGALKRSFEWKLYGHDRPADLDRRLLAAGFTAEPAETVMVGETADAGRWAFEVPPGVDLVPVTDRDGVELAAAVHERVFGTARDQVRARLLDLLGAGELYAVLAMAGGTPISAARLELHPGTRFAGLWGGGTVPEWRGRGVYRALIAYRAREAAARGYDFLQVDASSQSRPILLRLGFEALTTTTPYVHP